MSRFFTEWRVRNWRWTMRRKILEVVAASLFIAINTWAQQGAATVSGPITDATGARLSGVTVTATNTETGVVTTVHSNETGIYSFPSLQPGIYELSASL